MSLVALSVRFFLFVPEDVRLAGKIHALRLRQT
jgi:hypothetical protein